MDSGKVVLSHIKSLSYIHLYIYIIHIIQQNIANTAPYIFFSFFFCLFLLVVNICSLLGTSSNKTILVACIFLCIYTFYQILFSSITNFSVCFGARRLTWAKFCRRYSKTSDACALHSLDSRLHERRRLEPGRVAWLCYGCTQASESPLGAIFCTMQERATDSNSL